MRSSACILVPLLAAMIPAGHAAESTQEPADDSPVTAPVAGPQSDETSPAAEPQSDETSPAAEPQSEQAAAESEASPPAAAPPPVEEQPPGLAVHGYLKSRVIFRATDGANDLDLQNIFLLKLGNPERDRVTGYVLGDLSADLDGDVDEDGYHAFDSARDEIGAVVPFIYSAYADVHKLDALSMLRFGRQSIAETPEVSYFDGVRLESNVIGKHRFQAGAYAGFPVHLYENDDTLGISAFDSPADLLAGVYAESHLWQDARARADVQYLEGHAGDDSHDEVLSSIALWQGLGTEVDLYACYTLEDDESRDVQARATYSKIAWDFILQASYYELLLTRSEALVGTDAYYPILKEYVPYREYRALASKGFGEHVNVDVGLTIRRLVDHEESDFNHEFERYYTTLQLYDLLKEGSFFSLTVQRWDDQNRTIDSESVEFGWPIDNKHTLSAGTAHYLYKYDYYSDEERDDVRDYYLEVEREHSSDLRMSAQYSIEDDESSDLYHELRCEVLWSF